ncbi:MAG: hypothetical protein M5U28_33235 [Sandaracinaceae bacterium]|nr:hypothetical protein [Sandaracinaceae bacterium]
MYEAEHVELGYRVALKILDRDAGRDPRRRARFRREALAGARVRHRNVVGILDCGTLADGAPYLAMERIEGSTSRPCSRARGRSTPPPPSRSASRSARRAPPSRRRASCTATSSRRT